MVTSQQNGDVTVLILAQNGEVAELILTQTGEVREMERGEGLRKVKLLSTAVVAAFEHNRLPKDQPTALGKI